MSALVNRLLGENDDADLADVAMKIITTVCVGFADQETLDALTPIYDWLALREEERKGLTHQILKGDPFSENPGQPGDLVYHLHHLIKGWDTQQPENDREWDEAIEIRFPVLDTALSVLDKCHKLTPQLYQLAYESVCAWDNFEGFSVGDPFGIARENEENA